MAYRGQSGYPISGHLTALQRPYNGAFLFVLYAIAPFPCHRFIRACYDLSICEVT
jgi:hypothetical protein